MTIKIQPTFRHYLDVQMTDDDIIISDEISVKDVATAISDKDEIRLTAFRNQAEQIGVYSKAFKKRFDKQVDLVYLIKRDYQFQYLTAKNRLFVFEDSISAIINKNEQLIAYNGTFVTKDYMARLKVRKIRLDCLNDLITEFKGRDMVDLFLKYQPSELISRNILQKTLKLSRSMTYTFVLNCFLSKTRAMPETRAVKAYMGEQLIAEIVAMAKERLLLETQANESREATIQRIKNEMLEHEQRTKVLEQKLNKLLKGDDE